MSLFQHHPEPVTLHSGDKTNFLIDCRALTDADWEALAYEGLRRMDWPKYHNVIGIPEGGLAFARALERYITPIGPVLLADDVLTTGASMEEYRERYPFALGLVAFARGPVPAWIHAIWRLS